MRFLLGAVFLCAAALKALDPTQAVLAVGAYDLLPPALSLGVGLLLPGLEAAVGAALVTGFLRRPAALLAAVLSAGFLTAVLSAWWRGLDVTCGCFGPLSAALRAGPATAGFDLLLLAAALHTARRRPHPPPPS